MILVSWTRDYGIEEREDLTAAKNSASNMEKKQVVRKCPVGDVDDERHQGVVRGRQCGGGVEGAGWVDQKIPGLSKPGWNVNLYLALTMPQVFITCFSVISFHPHSTAMWLFLLSFPFSTWGNWGSKSQRWSVWWVGFWSSFISSHLKAALWYRLRDLPCVLDNATLPLLSSVGFSRKARKGHRGESEQGHGLPMGVAWEDSMPDTIKQRTKYKKTALKGNKEDPFCSSGWCLEWVLMCLESSLIAYSLDLVISGQCVTAWFNPEAHSTVFQSLKNVPIPGPHPEKLNLGLWSEAH